MKYLRNLAVENKKLAFYLVALVAIGVFALTLGRTSSGDRTTTNTTDPAEIPAQATATYHTSLTFEQEHALEARLEEFFSMVEDAGKVRVMLSPFTGRETIYAVDINKSESSSTEQDAQGGTRETHQYQIQENTVMITDRQGTDRPLVLREVEPQIHGIVIIAEGGSCPFVRDALTRAARAVLGLEAHRIQVLSGSF